MLRHRMIKRHFNLSASRYCHIIPRGFTLIELLVVISVIGLLLAVLMPALTGSRRKARAIVCSMHMHQLGMSSMMYTQDSEGQFARSSHSASVYGWLRWGQAFMPYLGYGRYHGSTTTAWDNAFKKFYHCPADQRKTQQWSYGKNVWFELESSDVANTLGIDYGPTYRTTMQVRHPAGTVEFGELSEDSAADHIMAHFWLMGGAPEIDLKRHGRMSNYSYLDGHVLAHDFKETFDISKPDNVIDDWNPGTARQ